MDFRPEFIDLTKPNDLLALKKHLSEMADELDILYTTTAPNGSISARQGRIALYNNAGTYTYWLNTTGSTVWVEMSNQTLWQVDGTETQLKTADEIDMQSKKIINVTDPASAQDASTKNYTDGKISKTTSGEISAMTEKTTLVDADLFLIEDSAASNAKKKVQRSNIILNLSNAIFAWRGIDTIASGSAIDYGKYLSNGSQTPTKTAATFNYDFYCGSTQDGTTYVSIIPIWKWTKIAGVNTLTVYCNAWNNNASYNFDILLDCGGQTGTVTVSATHITPSWRTAFTVDVSGLTNGTNYDVVLKMKNSSNPGTDIMKYCSGLIILGS